MKCNHKKYRLASDLDIDVSTRDSPFSRLLYIDILSEHPTVVVFLDIKAAPNPVDCQVSWKCMLLKCVPNNPINPVQVLHWNTTSQVRAYGDLSLELSTYSGVLQVRPFSPLLYNFVKRTFGDSAPIV